jgi:uncharacterized protein with PIN domain
MLVLIGGKEQNLKVTSVILEPNLEDPNRLKMFHCPDCTEKLVQYMGNVAMILPGPTYSPLPVIAFCRKCSIRYLFNLIY